MGGGPDYCTCQRSHCMEEDCDHLLRSRRMKNDDDDDDDDDDDTKGIYTFVRAVVMLQSQSRIPLSPPPPTHLSSSYLKLKHLLPHNLSLLDTLQDFFVVLIVGLYSGQFLVMLEQNILGELI